MFHDDFSDLHLAQNIFAELRWRAGLAGLWARLTRQAGALVNGEELLPETQVRVFLGYADIPVAQIRPAAPRQADFDAEFRPRRQSLMDGWVRAFLDYEAGAWQPVCLVQAGDHYVVADGHLRVSVARYWGLRSLRAEVWGAPAEQAVCVEDWAAACAACPA